jgi:Holliday junction resolvase RusA-like endonuclease
MQNPINTGEIYLANPTLLKLHTAGDYLIDWTGRGARAFKQNFLDPFPAISRNQFILSAVLKAALEAHQSMWSAARTDIDNIAHATLDALENRKRCDPNKWTVTFTVIASVAAVAAVPLAAPAAGAAVAAGMGRVLTVTAVGASSQVIAAIPPKSKEVKYQGETTRQIVDQMRKAITDLTGAIHDKETMIQQALNVMNDRVSHNPAYFVAKRPVLADASPKNVTGPDYLGDPP